MTPEEWIDLRDRLDAAAKESKQSPAASVELSATYGRLSDEDRLRITEVLKAWLLSEDEGLRFDACAVIHDHRPPATLPALRQLAHRLENAAGPSAPYEWAKVNRLIARLAEGPHAP